MYAFFTNHRNHTSDKRSWLALCCSLYLSLLFSYRKRRQREKNHFFSPRLNKFARESILSLLKTFKFSLSYLKIHKVI